MTVPDLTTRATPDPEAIQRIMLHPGLKPAVKAVLLFDLYWPGQSIHAIADELHVDRRSVHRAFDAAERLGLGGAFGPEGGRGGRASPSVGGAKGAPARPPEAESEVGAALSRFDPPTGDLTTPKTGERERSRGSGGAGTRAHTRGSASLTARAVSDRRQVANLAGFRNYTAIEQTIQELLTEGLFEDQIIEWCDKVPVFSANSVIFKMNQAVVDRQPRTRALPPLPAGAISRADDERKRNQDRSLW